jgi:hypothetical protein
MVPVKGIEDKDNLPHFSGEVRDCSRRQPRYYVALRGWTIATALRGWTIALFSVRQIKDKTGMGSNFTDYRNLVFANQAALEKAHKSVDLKYLSQMNRMATRLLNDAVFEYPTKETAARTKLHIMKNNEVLQILRGAVTS